MWDNLVLLTKVTKVLPWIAVGLVFLGGFVQLGKLALDRRIQVLETQQKKTPPKLDAQLVLSDKGNLFVVIESQNGISFRTRWLVVTENDQVVSGLMTSDLELHPTMDRKEWQYRENIQKHKVVNNFVELRLDYWSTHSAELNYPKDLSGKIVHKYRLVDGRPQPID